MTGIEFINLYWKQYLMIEKEFKFTTKYVAIDIVNFKSYSDAYAKLLLQIGSEVDVVAKELCREINSSSKAYNVDQYASIVTGHFPEFVKVTVACGDIDLNPWSNWTIGVVGNSGAPIWWQIYNGVKHNRNKTETYGTPNLSVKNMNYKLANQENVLNSLAGLYQLEQYLYTLCAHNKSEETPLPGSRLFRLKDQGWEKKHFGKDSLNYVEDGCLYQLEADIFYADI